MVHALKQEFNPLQSAIEYAEHGIRVVRCYGLTADGKCTCRQGADCKSPGKHPSLGKEWLAKASADRGTLFAWFRDGRSNLGIVVGPRSGIIDVEYDDETGRQTAEQLLSHIQTPSYSSGRSIHRLFRWTDDLPKKAVGKVRGLEIRTGANAKSAQSIAPPSRHHSGRAYQWLPSLALGEVEIAPLPDSVLGLAWAADETGDRTFNRETDVEVARAALAVLSPARAGDYESWLKVGMALKATDDSLLPDWDAWSRCSPKYEDGATAEKWESFSLNGVSIGSLIYWARQDTPGWRPPRRTSTAATSQGPSTDLRARIEVTPDEHIVIDQTLTALAGDETLYHRAGALVHIVNERTDTEDDGIQRAAGTPRIRSVSDGYLRERMSARCRFHRVVVRGEDVAEQQCGPPPFAVKAIHSRGFWRPLRMLSGVVETPVLRPDGTILDNPGYDASTGLLYVPGDVVPIVPANPTRADTQAAVETLLELVADFPFAGDTHRSCWLAGLLTVLARRAFSGPAPLFLIDANVRGSGKSLLTDVIAIVTTGRAMPRLSNPGDDDEARKRITALAIAGDPLVLIDNIAGTLGSASLDAALTSTVWKDRKLGGNEIVECALRAVWFATGNNVMLAADTSRRVCHVRLDSPLENPEEREGFRHPNLLAHVRESRLDLLTAGLTILRAFCVADRPDAGLKPWGSFEGWSALIRNAVVWAGLPDPGETRRELAESADRDAAALRALFAGWSEVDPDETGLTAAELCKRLDGRPDNYEAVRVALWELCGTAGGKGLTSRGIGNQLRRFKGRVIGNQRLENRDDLHRKVNRWRVTTIGAGSAGSAGSVFPISTREICNTHALGGAQKQGETHPANPADPATELCTRCEAPLDATGCCPVCATW